MTKAKNPIDGGEPTEPKTEPKVVHHHHGDGGGGQDEKKWGIGWGTIVLGVIAGLLVGWGVRTALNSTPAVVTATPTPAPPVRMVDVSGPDPTIVYAPPTPPTPAPAYVPTTHKVVKDPWGDDLVTKPTFK